MIPILNFGRHILNHIEVGITKEWMETNGLGSYAMGTVVGANTRKYHSLFTMTSPSPKLRRMVLVNRMEESVLLHGRRVDFSCQEYPGSISPQGHLFLESFYFDPVPRWVYAIDDLKIEKTFFLRSGEETAVIVYKHILGPPIKLILRPFFSCRDHESLIREDNRFKDAIQIEEKQIRCSVVGMPEFYTVCSGNVNGENLKIFGDGYWYKNLLYAQEEEQGLDYQEDLFSPGQIHANLFSNQRIAVIFSSQRQQTIELDRWLQDELFLRKKVLESYPMEGLFSRRCAQAADKFVIRRQGAAKILAAYPHGEDAYRETFMSLPGICLTAGRLEEARSILNSAVPHLRDGLLPNSFSPDGEPEYYNMDISLWFVWSVQKYWEATKDLEFLKAFKPSVEKILQSLQNGIKVTDPNKHREIRVDSDRLVWGSSMRAPLTWMNGKVNDWIATPRRGKPVEIQALWYNALQFCSEICLKTDGNDPGWAALAKSARDSFNNLFWNPQSNYLYDVIDGNSREGSIRPNALYAVSMPYEILDADKFKPLLETAWKTLYTSLGIRTLAPQEPHYHGIASGDQRNRITAAFNGSVSPFLIGPFVTTFFKTYGRDSKTREQGMHFLLPFIGHLSDMGLGMISEMFDGNSPHNPRGEIADSRSTAEILRVMKEEGLEL